jgi:NAD(P)-dependent dehydrogenase (short-subunit alcohol dehydrogenase family)
MNLKDKIVVITGGSKGFGKALTKAFLKEGSKVVISSRDKEEVKEAVMEMRVLGICADVTNENELTFLLNATVKELGDVDIWINNAGIWLPKTPVEDLDMIKVKKMFDVNVIGLINGTRVAIRKMKKEGRGTIINVISDSALVDQPKVSASVYGASKWAVNGFTKAIRGEYKNISILSIYPGAMRTSIFGKNKPDNYNDFMESEYVAEKVIENLKKEVPEEELVIKKPTN